MKKNLNFVLVLSIILTLSGCGLNSRSSGNGVLDFQSSGSGIVPDSNLVPDSKYMISSTIEILKPVNLKAMTNDAQSVEVISENDLTIKVKITVDPIKDQIGKVTSNPNWKSEYSKNSDLQKYLAPGITTNWDDQMRSELIESLAKSDINPDKLSDVEVVRKVSQWIFGSSEFQFQDHFISYDVEFKNGKAQIIPELKGHFDSEKVKNHFSTDDEALDQGIFGKAMFRARKFGNCTYSATLQATVLKALGIPTRLVLMVPAIDWNDQAQWNMIRDNIHQIQIRKTVLQGLAIQGVGSWGSHTFNEVYVGNQWVRLNYTNLGQKPADPQFFGLMLQVNEMSDWSEANLGRTWGIHAQAHNLVKLSSNNAYRSLEIKDASEVLNSQNNPPLATPELTTINLEKSYTAHDLTVPASVRSNLTVDPSFAVVIKSELPSLQYADIAVFRRNVSRQFVLRAPGVPDILIREVGSWFEQGFTALKFKPDDMNQLVAGTEYSLVPEAAAGPFHWKVSPSLKFVKPSAVASPQPPHVSPMPNQNGNVFSTTATVVSAKMSVPTEMGCPAGKSCIVLGLAEKFDLANSGPLIAFSSNVSMNFALQAEGQSELPLAFYGFTAVNQGQNGAFSFTIDENSMKPGVRYKIVYKSTLVHGQFSWVFADSLTVEK